MQIILFYAMMQNPNSMKFQSNVVDHNVLFADIQLDLIYSEGQVRTLFGVIALELQMPNQQY